VNRKLTTGQIYREARRLQARGELSGVRLRASLQRKYGARGSVERIYSVVRELVDAPRRPYRRVGSDASRASVPATAAEPGTSIDTLTAERDAAIARAALLEERYEADTAHWMREVDALRTRLAAEGRTPMLIYGRDPRDVVLELEAQLASAKRELAMLRRR
jgi:hypothetical protein